MPTPPLGVVVQELRRMVRPQSAAASDGQLLSRFLRRRDEGAFAELVERHGPLVLGVCRRVLSEKHEAEDVFQATFLILVRRAASLDRRGSLANWLYTVAHRLALNVKAQSARRRARERKVGEMRALEAPGAADMAGLLPVLDEELAALPEKYRAPLLLCYLQGKTNVEAARELGWRPGSMSRRLARGRELLRQRLLRRDVMLTGAGLTALLGRQAQAAVPVALGLATVRAGLRTVGGAALAGAVPAPVAALVDGTMKEMLLLKLKVVAAGLLMLGIAGAGAAVWPAPAAEPPAARPPAADTPPADSGPPAADSPIKEPGERATTDLQGDPLPADALLRLGTVRLRHGGQVGGVAISPDGQTAASGGGQGDPTVRLWDMATARELRVFTGHTGQITGLAFTRDGKQLISCANDATVRLWDVGTGAEVRQFRGHTEAVGALALAPDGKTLATASQDDTVRLWDVATGAELRSLVHSPGVLARVAGVQAVAFSRGGKTLASAGEDGAVYVWDPATGKELQRLTAHAEGATCVAFAPDGKALASGGREKTVRLWDPVTGKELRTFEVTGNPVHALAFSPDGKALAVGIQAKPLLLLDVATGTPLRPFHGSNGVRALAFSPDGKTLMTGSGNMSAYLFEVATGKERFPLPGHNYAGNLSFSPDGRAVRAAYQDQSVRVWDLAGRELRHITAVGMFQRGKSTAYSPDGKLVATAGASGAIRLYDLETGKKLRDVGKLEGTVNTLAWSADGKALAAGGSDGSLRVVDADSGEALHDLRASQESIWALAFSPDGKLLASSGQDRTVRVWDLKSGQERHQLTGPQGPVESLAFSPDGRTLAAGPRGNTVWVWDAVSGRDVAQLKGHTTWVYSVQFSADGRTLATGSLDRTVRLWETATWKERARFEGHRGGVVSLAFAPDGRSLASGSADSSVLVWDLTGRLRGGRLAPQDLEVAWSDLTGEDAAKAYRSICLLAASPEQALPLLRESLRPVAPVPAERLKALIARLDDDDFTVRERASEELAKLGGAAHAALRQALEGQPSAELRQRVQRLLEPGLSTDRRQERALEVLEGMATPEARRLLEELAKGAPGAGRTEEARAALERMAKRAKP
jgi:RNA polymerase sigma factor (sigma-70 family)